VAKLEDERQLPFRAAPLPMAPLDEPGRIACLRLIRSTGIGAVTFRELVNHHGGARAALDALPEISRRSGRRRPIAIYSERQAQDELETARRTGCEPCFTIEPGYPAALAVVEAPPPLLYIKGQRDLLSQPAIAIVGSRRASAAGTKLARVFAAELGQAGLVVVSGLARGIDAAAHEAALATGTVAVLAGGLDVVYPPEHAALQEKLATEGCLVAENPPGFQPRAKDFPRRNRLISGMSLGVVVMEAAQRSGTLVTARFAGEQGREVFAIPGHPLDPRAEGTNNLLKNGATLATEPGDILDVLKPMAGPMEFREPATAPPLVHTPSGADLDLSPEDRAHILAALGPQPADVDEIVRATGIGVREVRITLMELDLAGEIERHGNQLVSRRDPAQNPDTDL
jgi:DNA processing protein